MSEKQAQVKHLKARIKALGEEIAELQELREAADRELKLLQGFRVLTKAERDEASKRLWEGNGEGDGRWQQGRDGH